MVLIFLTSRNKYFNSKVWKILIFHMSWLAIAKSHKQNLWLAVWLIMDYFLLELHHTYKARPARAARETGWSAWDSVLNPHKSELGCTERYCNVAVGICLCVTNRLVEKCNELIINIRYYLLISFSNQSSKSFSAPSRFPQALLMSCSNITTSQTGNTNILNK